MYANRLLSRWPVRPAIWCLIFCSVPLVARAQEASAVAGHWAGKIETPGTAIEIDVDLKGADGSWNGDISIPAQGAKDLPLANIKVAGDRISFEMPGVPGDPRFEGRLLSGARRIEGEYTQSGQTMPFTLERGAGLAASARKQLLEFDAFVDEARQDWKVPGFAIGVVTDGEVVYAKGFGLRDREHEKPVTTRTLFAIGSTSKAFTTFAMGTLVDEGKLDWDEPVIKYLPEFRLYDEYATQHITPRDLVTHRSGLPRHDLAWYNSPLSRKELVYRMRYLPPNKDLREKWQYNNLMFMTAGYLVGRLTEGTWEQAVRSRIFEPLDMVYSNFSVIDSQKSSDFSLPYEEKDDKIRRMPFRNIDNVGPAGSINSCIEDMTKWLICQLDSGKFGGKTVVQEATLNDMHTPYMAISAVPTDREVSPGSYGLGWMIDSYRGHLRVRHGGGIDGFTTMVTLFPRDRIGVVAFANLNSSSLPGLVTLHATDRVFNYDDKDWNAEALSERKKGKEAGEEAKEKMDLTRKNDTTPAHALEAYVGAYEHPGYGVIVITLTDGRLVMAYNSIETQLEHWHYEVFSGLENPKDHTFEDHKIRFLTNMKGDVDAIATPFEALVDEMIFDRKPDSRMSDPKYLERFVGEYELPGQSMTITLKGDALMLSVLGQPPYDLVPDRDDEFNLKGLASFSVKFLEDDEGNQIARFNQPNGVFDAKRKR